jgi:threonylcarbamoyladenosine tRNA methylthiotransferase MtaB
MSNESAKIMTQKKVSFYTLGCKLNFAETSTITRGFTENGYEQVEFGEHADVVVINTCSVTQLADKKCRQAIGKASRNSPDAIIAVVGCYSQLKPDEIAHIEGVDLVLGNSEKFKIVEYVEEFDRQNKGTTQIHSCLMDNVEDFSPSFSLFDRTRSFLKVQDGCNYHCSYCTIPLARGNSRNQGIDKLVAEAQKISTQGIKEIVLTGVNIGDFGKSTDEKFLDLLRALDQVEGIERYRISSIEPNLLTDEIISFVAHSRGFLPHFHIPLQSGSNEILKLMSRRYKREIFRDRVNIIKNTMPMACIGADVIVGFPGETEALFDETCQFLNNLDISYLHVFPYSERRNTQAVSLPNKVSPEEKEYRSKILLDLSERKKMDFYQSNIEKEYPVLFESQQSKGKIFGFTPNYVKVETAFDKQLVNHCRKVKLTQLLPSGNMNIIFITD